MNRTANIRVALRTLDPAEHYIDPTRPRAQTDLQAILAQDPAEEPRAMAPSTPVSRPRRAGRITRRAGVLSGLAATVTLGLVAIPSFTGGDRAFATWRAVPASLSGQQGVAAADDCRQNQISGAGKRFARDLRSAGPAISERRGVWTTVVLVGADGFTALCITDDSAGRFTDGMIGSIGKPPSYAAPRPRELRVTDLGKGTISAGDISLVAGAVGSDITGVVYQSHSHGNVTATVSGGRFALWFPGDELTNIAGGVQVDVTYLNGQTGSRRLSL